MKRLGDWNTVGTVTEGHYEFVGQWLTRFGPVAGTDYYNVLVMRVDDTAAFPEALRAALAAEPTVAPGIGRIVPLTETFGFQNVEAFERQACHGVRRWFDALRGKRFHVRMHRRGFRGRLLSQHEELFLDHFVMDALAGSGARIDFDEPDVIIALETVGQRGGLSCWARAQPARYPFLKLD